MTVRLVKVGDNYALQFQSEGLSGAMLMDRKSLEGLQALVNAELRKPFILTAGSPADVIRTG